MAIQPLPSDRLAVPLEEAPTAELVKGAFDEARELIRLEVELAKAEVKEDARSAARAAVGFGIAAAAVLVMLSVLAVALVFALGATAIAALAVAGGILVIAVIAAAIAYGVLPKEPLERTRHRLESDVKQLKEHLA